MQNNQGRWPSLVAIAMLTNPAGVLGTIAPAIISGLTLEAHLPLLTAGRLMAVEFAAMTAAIMLLPLIMGRISDRTLAGTLIVGAVLGQLSSFSGEVSVIAFGRGILGFAEGGLYGLAIGALARAPRPDRAFAIAVFVNLIVSATLLTLATAAHLAFPAFGILALLVGFLVLTVAFVPAMPTERGNRQRPGLIGRSNIIAFLPGLVGMFLFAAGFGTVWPLVASIARSGGIGDMAIGHVLSIAGGAGIAGAAASILLAGRIGRALPLIMGSACLAVALAGSVTGHLWSAAPAVLFFWSFVTPYYFAFAAAADAEGRLAAFAGAMLPLGIAAGQAFAGATLDAAAPGRLGLSAAIMVIVAIAFMMLLHRIAGTASSAEPEAAF